MEIGQKFMVPTTNNINKLSHLKLSIQVSLNGLSFCILNLKNNTVEFLHELSFENKLNPGDLLSELQSEFNELEKLNQDFNSILVIYNNDLSTLVPKALFNEDNLADYLKFNSKILSSDFITYDEIEQNDTINVYIPLVNINNYIYEKFGEFTFKHASTIFIEQVLKSEKNSIKPKIFINVSKKSFEILAVENGNVSLYNFFEFKTKEDFIYYVLFTLEQLNCNPETIELVLFGDIDSKDELYKITYKYIRFVFFGQRPDNFKYHEQAQPSNKHSHFLILNSF